MMLFFAQAVIAQELRCGTSPPTDRERFAMIATIRAWNVGRSSSECTDLIDISTKTYKLVLEYINSTDSNIGFPSTKMPQLHAYIDSIFNPVGIYFEYYDLPISPSDCNNCNVHDVEWQGRKSPIDNRTDFLGCLWGRIVATSYGNISGQADLKYGRFWSIANYTTIVHELGHALGLLHTFDDFSSLNRSKNENVFQNDSIECPCNCKLTGDLICDTPVDPYDIGDHHWNDQMFGDQSAIFNSDNESDQCDISYSELDGDLVIGNVMSYHHSNASNLYRGFTIGQASFMKKNNEGKPWEVSGLPGGSGVMQPGFVVNQAMEITSPMDINGNIEIHSKLTIKNTRLSFMDHGSITIHPKGELILDNGHLVLFDGMGCIPEAESWEGIRIPHSGTSKLTLKNGSTINHAKTAIYSRDATLLARIQGGSRINSYFTQAIDVEGGKGIFEVQGGSVINGIVTFKNFYSGLTLSRSKINIPNNKKILIEQSGFVVKNGSIVNTDVSVVNNYGNQTVILRDATFNGSVLIRQSQYRIVVRDNIFNDITNGLILNDCPILDVYNNQFSNQIGLTLTGELGSTPLVFKNTFHNHSTSISNSQSFSNARLECNTMIGQGNYDWRLVTPIAKMQGNNQLAAGNKFSRTSGTNKYEVFYEGEIPITYFYKNQGTEEPININTGSKFEAQEIVGGDVATACDHPYPNTPSYPDHCNNGIQDGDETGIDCGGSCPKCNAIDLVPNLLDDVSHCSNGVLDEDETGIDCGGSCPPCSVTCNDGIQNNGEYGVDCGGPCPPCYIIPATCTDGMMNGNETGIDCGGPTCPPCPVPDPPQHCNDGIMNGDETGIDCGGSCPECLVPSQPPHCYNGVKDGDETGMDCGGSCDPCDIVFPPHCFNGRMDGNENNVDCGGSCKPCVTIPNPGTGIGVYTIGNHANFISKLNEIYGEGYFSSDRYKVIEDFEQHLATLDNGSSCIVQEYIDTYSASQPTSVIGLLAGISPNVSANAIHRLFANSVHYTSGQMLNILCSNPAVLSDSYISYIVYRTTSFSSSERALILSAALASDTRTEKEVLLNYKQQYQNAIIRDNIAMLSQNNPLDFNAIRSELATDPDPYKVFEIAQLYVEQGRDDLAAETLENVDVCRITDPYYRAQLSGLIAIYNGRNDLVDIEKSLRKEQVPWLSYMVNAEHGLATDLAAKMLGEPVRLAERRKYEPLQFSTVTNVSEVLPPAVEIYPNPASTVLTINISGGDVATGYQAIVTGADGKIVSVYAIGGQSTTVDVSGYVPGIYTVQVGHPGKTIYVTKFIKIQ